MIENGLLTSAERAAFSLRSLYAQSGYLPFKMSKFEEYELYVRNKEFLISDNVIAFNDTDGRLLAMKPDVTLSIIKNTVCQPGCKQKVYYNENVYRVSHKTHRFKEIMQAGLECIGDTDIIDLYEVIDLAKKSLAKLSSDFALDISHLGILSKVLSAASSDVAFVREATALIAEKNKHELSALCQRFAVEEKYEAIISELASVYGEPSEVLPRLLPICRLVGATDAYDELSALCDMLADGGDADKIRIDFSVVNDMNYYNGVVFKGFLKGVPDGILAGGEYGMLMHRMGKAAGAIGFAIYLDMLEEIREPMREYDVDALVIYPDGFDAKELIALKKKLADEGKSVSMQRAIPEKLRYKEIIRLDNK